MRINGPDRKENVPLRDAPYFLAAALGIAHDASRRAQQQQLGSAARSVPARARTPAAASAGASAGVAGADDSGDEPAPRLTSDRER